MSTDDGAQERAVTEIMNATMPNDGTREAYSLALEIKGFLQSVKDADTSIDSGGGLGEADLWVKVQGVEYHISVKRSIT
jgi:hypothetical protein